MAGRYSNPSISIPMPSPCRNPLAPTILSSLRSLAQFSAAPNSACVASTIVLDVKEVEERGVALAIVVVTGVVQDGDTAHRPAVPFGDEKVRLRVLVEGVLPLVELQFHVVD